MHTEAVPVRGGSDYLYLQAELVMLVKSDREKGENAASVPPCPHL